MILEFEWNGIGRTNGGLGTTRATWAMAVQALTDAWGCRLDEPKGEITIHTDRTKVHPAQVVTLLEACGWGADDGAAYAEKLRMSWQFYEVVAFAERASELVGYATAYSDRAFTSGMGELVVHPTCRRKGIGRRLLQEVETAS